MANLSHGKNNGIGASPGSNGPVVPSPLYRLSIILQEFV
jgi:hypothetical protein